MIIVITSSGTDLDAPASPVFGRCPTYIFVDTETMGYEAVANPAMSAPGGAGIQAAQFVVEQGAQAVLTGNAGPNAYSVFQASGMPIYMLSGGTVREAVEAYKAGRLRSAAEASVEAHAGMGMGPGVGMGRGMGRDMGRGMERSAWGATSASGEKPSPSVSLPSTDTSSGSGPRSGDREEEVADLKQAAGDLRRQLAGVMERLDNLEKGD